MGDKKALDGWAQGRWDGGQATCTGWGGKVLDGDGMGKGIRCGGEVLDEEGENVLQDGEGRY